jgi:hypothetical protein
MPAMKACKCLFSLLLVILLHACGPDRELHNEILVNGDPLGIGDVMIYNEIDFRTSTAFSVHLCSEGFNLTPDYMIHDSLLYHEGEWHLCFEYLLKPIGQKDYSGSYRWDTELKMVCSKDRPVSTMKSALYQYYSGSAHRLVSFYLQDAEISIRDNDSIYELDFTFMADTLVYRNLPVSIHGQYEGPIEFIDLRPGY